MQNFEHRLAKIEAEVNAIGLEATAAAIGAPYGLSGAEVIEEATAMLRFYDRWGRWPRDDED